MKFTGLQNIRCLVCGHSFYFNDSKVPDGEMIETICPNCKTKIKKKKKIKES